MAIFNELLYKLYRFVSIVIPQQDGTAQILTANSSVGVDESHTLSQC